MSTEISISQEFREEIETLKTKEQELREMLSNTLGQKTALERMLSKLTVKAQRIAERGKETGTSS